jgi:hypothetical protein
MTEIILKYVKTELNEHCTNPIKINFNNLLVQLFEHLGTLLCDKTNDKRIFVRKDIRFIAIDFNMHSHAVYIT